MPTPRSGQSKEEYLSMCMSSVEAKRTASDSAHRYAVCNGMWEQYQKSIEVGEPFDEQKAMKAASSMYKNKKKKGWL